jgi:Lar family restriction alleviation protein
MPAEEIKSCPFCGSHANVVDSGFDFFAWHVFSEFCVQCSVCGAEAGRGKEYLWLKSRTLAIERWNRRANAMEGARQQPTTQLGNAICPHYFEATDGVHVVVVGRCDCKGKQHP